MKKKKINEERSKKKGKLQRQTSFDAKKARLERNQYSAPSAIRSNSWGLGESLEDTVSSDRNSIDAKIKGLTADSLKSGSLDLTRMKLKSFPTKIVENVIINKTNDIHKIQEISLYKNQLQNLPNKFYDLFKDNLVELHINDNVFVTVPDSLKQFVALEKLNVSNNRIKEGEDQFLEEFLSKIVCSDTTVEVVDKKGDIKGYITNKELETSLVKS